MAFEFIDTISHMINWHGQLIMMLSDVQHLSIDGDTGLKAKENQNHVLESVNWRLFLRPFLAVEVLHVSRALVKQIASALEDTPGEEMAAQVLPALQVLWLDNDQDKKEKGNSVERFLSLRGKFGHPVVMAQSRNEFIERLNPHQLELELSECK